MIDEDFMEFAVKVGRGINLDQLSSKLTGILYIEPTEISMEDLAKKTGYSLASISNKMKILVGTGIVERRKKPGSKKVYYYMDKNLHKVMHKMMRVMFENEIQSAKDMIPPMIKKYEKTKLTEIEQKKLKNIKYYHKQMLEFEEMFIMFSKQMEKKW